MHGHLNVRFVKYYSADMSGRVRCAGHEARKVEKCVQCSRSET